MTYLSLCADAQQECDITGTEISAVTNQVGELKRIVKWVRDAWTELQGRHENWRWMRSTFTVNTVASTDAYAYTACTDSRLSATISRFKRWLIYDEGGRSNFKIYLSSAGVGTERWLSYMDWASFRSIYKVGTQNNGPPAHYTIDPQNRFILGPNPDAIYVVTGEYQMSAQVLSANDDVPEMPADYHQLIVYMAMRKYAGFESAPDVLSRAVTEGNRLLRQLEINQLPEVLTAPPLA